MKGNGATIGALQQRPCLFFWLYDLSRRSVLILFLGRGLGFRQFLRLLLARVLR